MFVAVGKETAVVEVYLDVDMSLHRKKQVVTQVLVPRMKEEFVVPGYFAVGMSKDRYSYGP